MWNFVLLLTLTQPTGTENKKGCTRSGARRQLSKRVCRVPIAYREDCCVLSYTRGHAQSRDMYVYRDSQYSIHAKLLRQLWREGACVRFTQTRTRSQFTESCATGCICKTDYSTSPQAASRNNAVAISIAPIGPGLLRRATVLLAALMAALLARRHSSLGG